MLTSAIEPDASEAHANNALLGVYLDGVSRKTKRMDDFGLFEMARIEVRKKTNCSKNQTNGRRNDEQRMQGKTGNRSEGFVRAMHATSVDVKHTRNSQDLEQEAVHV